MKILEAIIILSKVLDEYEFNNCCSDFDFQKVIQDVEVRRAIMKEAYEMNGSPEYFEPEKNYAMTEDYFLHFWLRTKRLEILSKLLEKE